MIILISFSWKISAYTFYTNWNLQNTMLVIFGIHLFHFLLVFASFYIIVCWLRFLFVFSTHFSRYNSEGEFDEGFVHILIQAVSKHMKTVNYVSLEQVRAYLASTGIVKNVCLSFIDFIVILIIIIMIIICD